MPREQGAKAVVDTSVIIGGKLPELIEGGAFREIVVPYAVLDELQAQASKGREVGFTGLEELKKARKLSEEKGVEIRFVGDRPRLEDIRLANSGRIDALIKDVATAEGGILVTADYVQALVAEAEGLPTEYFPREPVLEEPSFESFFEEDTMSVHLKEGVVPMAKRGEPGKFEMVELREKVLTKEELEEIIKEIDEAARIRDDASIAINTKGARVIQLGEHRIAVTRPPFSDGLEVTVVRPVIKLRLEDYDLSDRLMDRLRRRAEGILVAGPPGSGKTAFCSSLADFYASLGKVVKTMESPRDLQVGPSITQYGPLGGSFAKTADILLLVRPDYTVFDEVRKTKDFKVFADLRLAGVGMVGVVHASAAVDAVQRFIGRLDLGMIPSVLDTVIFIKYGRISALLTLELTVKVPEGMLEADLARPVVEIKDFESGKLKYEIYTYGEESVVMPVEAARRQTGPSPINKLAAQVIRQELARYDKRCEVEFTGPRRVAVRVDQKAIARLIGRDGRNISQLEDKLGIRIDVEPKG